MTQYEGIRTASDGELDKAYSRLIRQANSYQSGPALKRASIRWLGSVCDEAKRRYPDDRGSTVQGDPGDEIGV